MSPHRTYSLTQPNTHKYINDYLQDSSDTPPPLPIRRATMFPAALLVLALGLGLAILMMLGTWWSLSTRATTRVTIFVAHPEEQTLFTDALVETGLAPAFLEDILIRF